MKCPKCNTEIPPELITAARQAELAKRKRGYHPRPGAKGLVRNPAGKNGTPQK